MKTNDIQARRRNAAIQGAKRFAEADRSDPFAYARAMTHINVGIALPDPRDGTLMYDAVPATETRTLAGGAKFSDGRTDYDVTVWRDGKRA